MILKHSEEIERLHKGVISWPHETVEDPAAFAMEKHLEDFLIKNWSGTELSGDFDIYEEDGEKVDKYALRMTVSVRHRGKTQIVIRANAQFGLKPVTDPEPYQQFFTSLGKAMFLTAHQVD